MAGTIVAPGRAERVPNARHRARRPAPTHWRLAALPPTLPAMSESADGGSRPAAARQRKPSWLKVRAPGGDTYRRVKHALRSRNLHTVCEQARCPNVGECWGGGTATVLLLGPECSRNCRFCGVRSAAPGGRFDPGEPTRVAEAVAALGLRYVVLTMVTRDDLEDGGAGHVARTVTELRRHQPGLLVETLVSDFGARVRDLDVLLTAKPDVFAHNVEVTRRMTPMLRDRRFQYDASLGVLRRARDSGTAGTIKSSLMVGVGETDDEVMETLVDLHGAGVEVVTLGQYLRPTAAQAPVDRYVTPEQFAEYERFGRDLGFAFVVAGPLVRSSYHAAEAFVQAKAGLVGIRLRVGTTG